MKSSKKIISLLLAVIIALSLPLYSFAVSKEEIQADLEAEIAKKEQEIANYQQKIDAFKNDASKQEEYIDELQKQIDAYDDEINLLNQQIDELNAKISTLDKEIQEYEAKISKLEAEIADIDNQIKEKQEEVDATYELLSERLCAAYMAGETSELEIFLSAKDFSEFLERSELIYQVSKHDTAIVADLKESITTLNKMIKDLDEKRADLEESKIVLDNQRAQLDSSRATVKQSKATVDQKVAQIQSKIDKVNSYIGSLNKQSSQYQKLIAKADAEKAAFKIEIDNLVNNIGSAGDGQIGSSAGNHNFEVSTKGIICPLQGSKVAIREYSWNHAKRGNHNVAMDLGSYSGSSMGRSIYSIADGKVLKAAYNSYNGNYILIDHGSGVVTYYGHCSSMAVSTGATVKQGQVIGYVGATGYVTGPHLHFEIRVNGKQVTPENYLKNASGAFISPLVA